MASTNREQHEKFISGHNGTSTLEVALVTNIPCVAVCLRDVFMQLFLASKVGLLHRSIRFFTDFILIVFPNILSVTLLSDHVGLFMLCLLSLTTHGLFLIAPKSKSAGSLLTNLNLSEKKQFVTNFRSIINVCTAVGILAVDFPVFPRRFAKAETFGFGVMDAGVGGFVLANAIVSPEARGTTVSKPFTVSLRKAITSSLPLLVLGFARLISVKSTDYQEHVTEYGVHWNFFFTLAGVKILSSVITSVVPASHLGLSGFVMLGMHQAYLSTGGADHVTRAGDRQESLLQANREGIFSLPGYVALYLLAVQLGQSIFLRRDNIKVWLKWSLSLAVLVTCGFLTTHLCHTALQPVSRRLVNTTYIAWTLSTCGLMLLLCLLGDIACTVCCQSNKVKESTPVPSVLQAVSYNALLFFLLANVMTGLVNKCVNTLHTDTPTAVLLLCLYMFVICSVLVVLKSKNIQTKFW